MTTFFIYFNPFILITSLIWIIIKFPKGIFKYFLIFLLFSFLFANAQVLLRNLGNVNLYFYFTIWPSILFSATPLMVFIFFIYLLKRRYTFDLFHFPLVIPILLGIFNFLYFHFFLSRPEQLSNISDFFSNGWDKEVIIGYFELSLTRIIRHSIGFISGLYLLIIYRDFKKVNKEDFNKKKINNFYFYFLSFWVIINFSYLIIGFIDLDNKILFSWTNFFSVIISFLFFIFLSFYTSILMGYPLLVNANKSEASLLNNWIISIDPLVIQEKLTHWENTSNAYLSADFTIKDLINETGLESELLHFHLTSIKGLDYNTYITNLRISYAIKLIEEGFLKNNNIAKLAENSGFKNVKSFNNTFLSIMNCLPENYNK